MGPFITADTSKIIKYNQKFCLMANYIQDRMSDYGLELEAKNMGRSLIGVDLFSNELVLPPPKKYEEVIVTPRKDKNSEIEEEKENSVTPRKKKQAKNLEMEEEKENSVTPKKNKQLKKFKIGEEKENSVTPKQVKSTENSQICAILMQPPTPEVPPNKIVLKIKDNTERTKTVVNVSADE